MSKKQILGLIGGAGVAATNKFHELLEIEYTKKGAFRDSHHPEIISYQATKVPSRSMYIENRGESFVPGYIEIGKKLKNAGASLLCMTCNTAHYAVDEISENVDLPFINLVEEVVKKAKAENKLNIGLMVSDGSRMGKVYEKYFEQFFPEANIIYPNDEMQQNVTRGIVNIKNNNRFLDENHLERPKYIFLEVCKYFEQNGVDVIIAGCTDIRVDFLPSDFTNLVIIDSLELLVQIVLDKFPLFEERKKREQLYDNLSKRITKDTDTRFKSKETSELDAEFVKKFRDKKKTLLDLGAGTGLLINKINDSFYSITAVEKYKEFSNFIQPNDRVKVINEDIIDWDFPLEKFDIVTSFGVMHYFSRDEATLIYKKIYEVLDKDGIFILKNQLGVKEDVVIDNFSEELQTDYYAEYRQVDKEVELLKSLGFSSVELVDIYSKEYNRWDNTHFYAIVCKKN